jgi:hypothetical protein
MYDQSARYQRSRNKISQIWFNVGGKQPVHVGWSATQKLYCHRPKAPRAGLDLQPMRVVRPFVISAVHHLRRHNNPGYGLEVGLHS